MLRFRVRSLALLVLMLCAQLTPPVSGTPRHESRSQPGSERKVKRESDIAESYQTDRDESESPEEIIYDQRQVGGETNIRLNIKNFQLQLPESQLAHFRQSDMAQLIRNSVLQLLGLPAVADTSSATVATGGDVSSERPLQELTSITPETEQRPTGGASMLQVNGNNLPAKFFLEISDFLMNTYDNDAVDDKRVETNHNQQQQQQMQHHQQQQQQLRLPTPQLAETPLYAMEEIKIERVANSNNVQNETIIISKKIKQVAPVPVNGTALETVSTENRFSSNATRNATENEDRFVQTKPIRLDTVVMQFETDVPGRPKTLREKVIWKMHEREEEEGSE